MRINEYGAEIVKELNQTLALIAEEEASILADHILRASKVFVAGAGRSGLMIRAFAMRMMQMGIEVYVVGETVTPNLGKEDLFIIGSGSGETRSLVPMAEKAKSLGGTVAIITISPESTIGKMTDIIVRLPGSTKEQSGNGYKTIQPSGNGYKSIQPMGALFEQTLLVFCDAVVLKLMESRQLDSATMYGRHANLE
ncbi:6-phospho-3-hexuloisomerase [Paenibacillus radicis (ex Gao et al. 2016)]|uniref:3-hexulose-6-phosphate isomerase n=1 Tax=Paenibacillus radicis (ex Gao et al. 2016) TaxID=1737354 RepID=A0A917M3T3_9BACL|nr:6-phospho-3-hexuloisomerase [Paenibacillus radicis (ex Gao et al. 2016)]GGG75874.1 3-hexulose-6-phosphate isomerase [Paenibacillus radicis (ex Gao et al. 2016)]